MLLCDVNINSHFQSTNNKTKALISLMLVYLKKKANYESAYGVMYKNCILFYPYFKVINGYKV